MSTTSSGVLLLSMIIILVFSLCILYLEKAEPNSLPNVFFHCINAAADDVEEIQNAVKAAIQQCCLQLKQKIARQQAAREQRQRKKNLTKYIPNVASAVYTVLRSMADVADSGYAVKRRKLDALHGVVGRVTDGEVTREVLQAKLTEHVERIDTDMVRNIRQYRIPKSNITCKQ